MTRAYRWPPVAFFKAANTNELLEMFLARLEGRSPLVALRESGVFAVQFHPLLIHGLCVVNNVNPYTFTIVLDEETPLEEHVQTIGHEVGHALLFPAQWRKRMSNKWSDANERFCDNLSLRWPTEKSHVDELVQFLAQEGSPAETGRGRILTVP